MNSDKQLNKYTNKWIVMLLTTIVIASVFYLYKAVKVKNIGEIQFSQNINDFNTNIALYLETIKANTYYDFLFIIAYSILFYLAYRVFQSSMRIPISKLGVIFCLVPGLFDVFENIILLSFLNNTDSLGLFNTFWLMVRAKWTFVIPFFIINVTILVYYILKLINSLVK